MIFMSEAITTTLDALRAALDAVASPDLTGQESAAVLGFCQDLHRLMGGLEGAVAQVVHVAAEGDGWKATGAASASHWLAAASGSSVTKARSAVALGKSLKACPELAAKVVACVISPENARALGRAIHKPAFELDKAELLKAAERLSPAKLNNEIDQWLAMVDGPGEKEREARAHAARSLRFSATADNMVRATVLLTNEDAKVVQSAIGHIAGQQRLDETGRTLEQRNADALTDLCAAYAAGDVSGGRQRPQLLITAPLEVLEQRAGRAVVHGANGTISADAVRRLCCDANVHRIITDGASAILDFGRSVRTATVEQFKALTVRDGGCVIPGCDRPPGWCQAHHWKRDWIEGGETNLADLGLVCSSHHHLIHDDGWQLTGGPDRWRFTPPVSHAQAA